MKITVYRPSRLYFVVGLAGVLFLFYLLAYRLSCTSIELFPKVREFRSGATAWWLYFTFVFGLSLVLLFHARVSVTIFDDGIRYVGVFRTVQMAWTDIVRVRTGTMPGAHLDVLCPGSKVRLRCDLHNFVDLKRRIFGKCEEMGIEIERVRPWWCRNRRRCSS
jgi:hypothetical protein